MSRDANPALEAASAPNSALRGADLIARRLAEAGCRFAFGIPGGEVLALFDALSRAGLRVVTSRHENSAGFMAEGTYHATGAPGVLVATIGPGVSNAVNVVAHAHQDRVPLLVLTGCIDAHDRGSYTHQIFDHRAVLAPLTKATFSVDADSIAATIDAAVTLAMSDPPGPVHLDVPIGVGRGAARESLESNTKPIARVSAEPARLSVWRERLTAAERPLILAGVEAVQQDAAEVLRALVDATGAPIITTYKGKGLVDERSASSLGAAGLSPAADALLLPLVRAADVVVLAGYDPIEMRIGWRRPFEPDAAVLELASVLPTHGMYTATETLIGDLRAHLRAITTPTRGAVWADRRPAKVRAALTAAFAAETDVFGPLAIAHALRAAVPSDAVITVDTGAHRIALSQAYACHSAHLMLQSSGLCTMGCALPLAIGRKLAEPTRAVVAVVGDGGLDMTLGELATARDLGTAIVIVVVDDASLALIELKQRKDGFANLAVDSGRTRYADVARALGGYGVVAEDAQALGDAVRAGLARDDTFTLVHCPIARRSYDTRI